MSIKQSKDEFYLKDNIMFLIGFIATSSISNDNYFFDFDIDIDAGEYLPPDNKQLEYREVYYKFECIRIIMKLFYNNDEFNNEDIRTGDLERITELLKTYVKEE